MNSTQLDPMSLARLSQITKQLALPEISAHPSSSSAFLYLLPPCLVLLAVDIVAQYSNRQTLIANARKSLKDKEEIDRLGNEVLEGQMKIRDMDKRLALEKFNSKYLSRTLLKQRNFARHRQRLAAHNDAQQQQEAADTDSPPQYTPGTTAPPTSRREKPTGVCAPFTSFCERLVFQNKIWKQQREIKALKTALLSMRTGGSENAFQAFCDRLILTNKIWKQQKEIEGLIGEAEKLKRSRVAAVTRAAKQMVQDVRKERLTEEFVRELVAELGECRQEIATLRTEHEREIRELANLYRKDCQRMSKEVELLRLGQDAKAMEQELSNEMEDDLVERLSLAESRAMQLDAQLPQPYMGYASEDTETLSGDELEGMSDMSTATYVGSGGDRSPNVKSMFNESPDGKLAARRARFKGVQVSPLKVVLRRNSSASLRTTPGAKSPSVPYAGFSFNPLFFGNPTSTRSDNPIETASQEWRAGPTTLKTAKAKAEQPKRVQWRF